MRATTATATPRGDGRAEEGAAAAGAGAAPAPPPPAGAAQTPAAPRRRRAPLPRPHPPHLHLPTPEEVIARIWGTAASGQRVSESLDYEPVQSRVQRDRCRAAARHERDGDAGGGGGGHGNGKRRVYGYTGHTLAKFLVTIATGVATGAFAVAMSSAMGAAGAWRVARVQAMLDEASGFSPASAPGGGGGLAAESPLLSSSSSAAALSPPPPPPLGIEAVFNVTRRRSLMEEEEEGENSGGASSTSSSSSSSSSSNATSSSSSSAPPPPPPPAPPPRRPLPPARAAWPAFLWSACFSCTLVAFAVGLVQYWAPQAAGAGVTLVMAYLNGNHVPNLLRGRTLAAKFVGTVCSVSAGLPMGPEGPMVHIGACVGSLITYAQCSCLRTGRFLSCLLGSARGRPAREARLRARLSVLDDLVGDADHREAVSAGLAAGISAAFGAPIGGVLFAMEEACSFWSRKTAWRCFLAAVAATFTMAQLDRDAARGMIGFSGIRTLGNREWALQLPLMAVNAGVAGLLGAAFNSARMWLWRLRASRAHHLLRIGEVLGLALLCVSLGFALALGMGRCLPKDPEWREDGYGMRFLCPEEGTHNDLATLFLSPQHHTIVKLFSIGSPPGAPTVAHFSPLSLAVFVLVYLALMGVASGVAIPGGLFMPSIMVGAAWGALWGSLLRMALPASWGVQPGLYALMAGAGVLGGVFRSTISLVALVLEGTRGVEFLGGVIMSVVVANWVAHHVHADGVYESELERIGDLYFLRDEPPHRLQVLTAQDVMATGVHGFLPVESAARVLRVLRGTTHNGFPVWEGKAGAALRGGGGGGGFGGPAARDEAEEDERERERARRWEEEEEEERRDGGQQQQGTPASPAPLPPARSPRTVPLLEPAPPGRLEGLVLRSQLLVLLQRRQFCDAQGRPVGRPPGEDPRRREAELETEMRTFFQRYFTHNRYISATSTPLDALQLDGVGGGDRAAGAGRSSAGGANGANGGNGGNGNGNGGGNGGGRGGAHSLDGAAAAARAAPLPSPAPVSSQAAGLGPLPEDDDAAAAAAAAHRQPCSSDDPLAGLHLDLRPYMNRSPFTVRRDCSAARAHQAFVGLGLRHLVVVDGLNAACGIITRKDLDHAAGHGWWRMSAVAPKPHRAAAAAAAGGPGGAGGGGRAGAAAAAAAAAGRGAIGRVVGQGGDLLRKLGGSGGGRAGSGGGRAGKPADAASARLLGGGGGGGGGGPASSSSSPPLSQPVGPPPPPPPPPNAGPRAPSGLGSTQDAVL